MKFLLDTNIFIYWLKGKQSVEAKILEVGLPNISMSFISACELFYGANKSHKIQENLKVIQELLENVTVINSEEAICRVFGELKASQELAGKRIDDADLLLAACAIGKKLILVTNNEKHFKNLKGLKVENWSTLGSTTNGKRL